MSTTTIDLQPHGGGHGHDGQDPHFQHHYTNMEQQFDTSKIGMWLFLVTEIMLFGGLFLGFGLMQSRYPREFVEAHTYLQRSLGALNTVVLLVSSWTMVMAVHSARTNQRKKTVIFLAFTILCACIFLGVKYFEYSAKFEEGLLPAKYYWHKENSIPACPPGPATATPAIPGCTHGYATFFAFYFMMTGLHGIHIVVGIGLLLWIMLRANKGEFSKAYYTPVDLVGLYWHIVDMIWIYLFPLYYLIS
jgi:cytochrome c oxidase subunit 3